MLAYSEKHRSVSEKQFNSSTRYKENLHWNKKHFIYFCKQLTCYLNKLTGHFINQISVCMYIHYTTVATCQKKFTACRGILPTGIYNACWRMDVRVAWRLLYSELDLYFATRGLFNAPASNEMSVNNKQSTINNLYWAICSLRCEI